MALLIILIALAVERFTALGPSLRCGAWVSPYLDYVQKGVGNTALFSGWLGIITVALPLLVVIGLLQLLFSHILLGIPGYIFSLGVLLYCIGPVKGTCKTDNSSGAAKNTSQAQSVDSESETSEQFATNPYSAKAKNTSRNASTGSQSEVLWVGNRNLFAVILWFVALGAIGAFLYRLFLLLEAEAEKSDSKIAHLASIIKVCGDLLDWIPVRIVTLCYLLVGNFTAAFPQWWERLISKPEENRTYLESCGVASLSGSVLEEEESSKLNERVLVLLLVVLALLTITAWI